jgi:hypothetical protein
MTGSSRLTIEVVRDAVRKRVEEASFREIADEVGMSFSGLRSFCEGTSPHRQTREKLVRWYHAQSRRPVSPSRDDVETAIAVLLSYFRDESKARAVRERQFREVVERLRERTD